VRRRRRERRTGARARRMPTGRLPAARASGLVAALVLLAGCGSAPELPGIVCTPLNSADGRGGAPDDTLDLLVQLEGVPEDGVELLLRVDALADVEGIRFETTPPPTAVATSLTLTTAAVFTVCVAEAPLAVVYRGTGAPHGKAWARVGADRPVRAWIQRPGDRGVPEGALVVAPGGSGRARFGSADVAGVPGAGGGP